VWRSAGTYGVRSSRLSKALKPGAEASQGRVGPCLIIWGLASRQPGATNGELFTERPSVTCRSASRGLRALVIMSRVAELRLWNPWSRASKGLTSNWRPSIKATSLQGPPGCVQYRTHVSTPSFRATVSIRKHLNASSWSGFHYARFISQVPQTKKHRAYVALGSNMGDRVAMIEQACKEMEASGKIKVLRTSSLWETKAMYVVDQDMFVNGACEVRPPTSLALSILTSADRDVIGPDAVARQAPGC
jgi:hypothetical protein